MDLAKTFYISVYCLAALSGVILAWAEYTPSVTMLTPLVAITMLFLNERNRVFRLDGIWVAVAGFCAFVLPAIELIRGDEEYRLLSGAHLLVILQWVLLAYHKTAHQYWWVCALSCLQVAIAAVLTTSPIFGVFILIYMFSALWTLSLFTLILSRLRFGLGEQASGNSAGGGRTIWLWPELHRSPASDARVAGATLAASKPDPQSAFQPFAKLSEFRGTFQCEPRETDLGWRFVIGITGMSAMALTFGLILFLVTPRVWIGAVNPLQDAGAMRGARQITGFSENVRLGDFGRILESSAPVLEMRLLDDSTDTPLTLDQAAQQVGQDETLLRGAAMAVYDRAMWIPFETRLSREIASGPSPLSIGRNRKIPQMIRQEIRLEPMGTSTLFTLGHPLYVKLGNNEAKAFRHKHTRAITTPRGIGGTKYTVWSPKEQVGRFESAHNITKADLSRTYSLCPPKLTRLIQLTAETLKPFKEKAGTRPLTDRQIAQILVQHLRDSGNYRYSLERTVIDPTLDPVEDFLLNRKYGHCQYFASALALMLRVENIPTCVITGFKGGIENPQRQIVEVQQRHAHAWVEAFIDGDWMTLDATPPDGREEVVAQVGDRYRIWHQLTSMGSAFWTEYVLNMSFSKQQQDLYGPAQEMLQSLTGQTKGANSIWLRIAGTFQELWNHPEKWFSWQGGLIAFVLMLLTIGIIQGVRGLQSLYRLLRRRRDTLRQEGIRLEFHQRYMALLKSLGWMPYPEQTQREFAAHVTREWRHLELPPELKATAIEVADAYDAVRFGNQILEPVEQSRLLQCVSQLENHARDRNKNNAKSDQTSQPA